jgi:UDP-galactopyranose mutase
MAYLLKKEGHEVTVVEKNPWIGGLCKTFTQGANKYEFGPHVLHADKPRVREIVGQLAPLKETRFKVRSCPFNDVDRLFDYPLSVSNILRLDNPEDIIWELYKLNPDKLDNSNFASCVISMIGPTMYDIFIKNYTKKQWGVDPSQMSAKWVPKRIFFSKDNETRFHKMWSAYPPDGYDEFFDTLTKGVNVIRGSFREIRTEGSKVKAVVLEDGRQIGGDLFVSSIPIDILLHAKDHLTYRGTYKSFIQIRRQRMIDALWYTFPNHYNFTRIVEYKGYNFENNNTTITSAAFPFDSGEIDNIPEKDFDLEFKSALQYLFKIRDNEVMKQFGMKDAYSYPVITERNESLFNRLLYQLTEFDNLFTVGRLGLFSYVPMYICINQCLQLIDLVKCYHALSKEERHRKYLEIR